MDHRSANLRFVIQNVEEVSPHLHYQIQILNDNLWLQGALGEDGPAGAMGDQGPEVYSETFQSWLFRNKEKKLFLRNLEE